MFCIVGQRGELRGCHNDVSAMKKYIVSKGYTDDEIHMKTMLDDGHHENPSKTNMEKAFDWLVSGAVSGDNLFFHYSGHGGSIEDDDGDEKDGLDETLVPVDYGSSGQIRDDEIFEKLITKVPTGVHMFVVMDCCHSGSILDLPYALKGDDLLLGRIDSGEHISTTPNSAFGMRLIKLGLQLAKEYSQGASTESLKTKAMAAVSKDLPGMLSGFAGMMSKKK